MSEMLKTLSNIRSLRVFAREQSLETLEAIAEKLAVVIEEKREAIKAQELENAKRLEGLNKYKELLAEDGLSLEELVALLGGEAVSKKREPRATRPAKYKFFDENGTEKFWTGQGRTPKALQAELDKGRNLSEFEI